MLKSTKKTDIGKKSNLKIKARYFVCTFFLFFFLEVSVLFQKHVRRRKKSNRQTVKLHKTTDVDTIPHATHNSQFLFLLTLKTLKSKQQDD